jgi:DNA integrity scanning protein DisA with diadenylate cyclase activity
MTRKPERPRERHESQLLIQHAFELARTLSIHQLLVQTDEPQDIEMIVGMRSAERIIWGMKDHAVFAEMQATHDVVVYVPETSLTPMSQMRLTLFLAVLNSNMGLNERLICLAKIAGSPHLDTLFITNLRRTFPWFRPPALAGLRKLPAIRHFGRLVEIALRLAAEGREGRPIGTTFVLGDPKELAPYLRQLILNPCAGHPPHERTIHTASFLETLREFAALDGAFVISHAGVVEAAGAYLDAPTKRGALRRGFGARHAAAMAITAATESFAFVISESSGTVTVFQEGRILLELEKPDATTPRPRH